MSTSTAKKMLEAELLDKYRELVHEPPDWAYSLAPSVPFVGEQYGSWGGVLVYASAENLSLYERAPASVPPYLQDERRFNRHRAAYDCRASSFFPDVHMAPFSNGSLLVAAAFVFLRRFGAEFEHPHELLESIAAANLCKFSIRVGEQGTNKDYLGQTKMNASLPYIRVDVSVLKPKLVLVPISAQRNANVSQCLTDAGCEVLPIYQFNAGVVNRVLREHHAAAKELEAKMAGTQLARWVNELSGYSAGYAYRYLVHLDIVLKR